MNRKMFEEVKIVASYYILVIKWGNGQVTSSEHQYLGEAEDMAINVLSAPLPRKNGAVREISINRYLGSMHSPNPHGI